jgi:hypothetical protein
MRKIFPSEYPDGRRQVGELRLRWKDNTRIKFREIGWEA